jgi:hypothetical protein
MKLLTVVPRREAIKLYLDREAVKKNKPIPPTFWALDLDDPNVTDQWLSENGYKCGVLSGFAQWAFVELSLVDIGNIAVVDGIFKSGKVLKDLAGCQEFRVWIPNKSPLPVWYAPLEKADWRDEYSIFLRPPTPGERLKGASLYVEDGSGRSICYYRSLLRTGTPSRMRGYIGFEPSPRSVFLQTCLEREFTINAPGYSTLESTFKAMGVRYATE